MTATRHQFSELAQAVLSQAQGCRQTEAAARLIITACGGYLLPRLAPWTEIDRGRAWVDYRAAIASTAGLSGGERRVLHLAGSLATHGGDAVTVNLNDALSGLDDHNSRLVLRAVTYALGLPAAD